MRRQRNILLCLITIAVMTMMLSCAFPNSESPSPPRAPTATAGPHRAKPTIAAEPPEATTRSNVEVWQWALGRSWDDPVLSPYFADLKQDGTYRSLVVVDNGFKLLFDPRSGRVAAVLLYNDEARLGLPPGNLFGAYPGRLPGGLTWDMTGPDVVNQLGEPDTSYTAGANVQMSFTWYNVDGYQLIVTLNSSHRSEFPTAPIHNIQITRTE